jgi:hypothetical protein
VRRRSHVRSYRRFRPIDRNTLRLQTVGETCAHGAAGVYCVMRTWSPWMMRTAWRRWLCLPALALLAACPQSPSPPPAAAVAPTTPAAASSAVADGARDSPPTAPAVPQAPVTAPTPQAPPATAAVAPPGPLYYCEIDNVRTAIDFEPRVEALCRRHPEMSACQYARSSCRTRGGRVLAVDGSEVTLAMELEYDKRVNRVTFQADGPARPRK